jgi:fucokinase
MVSSEPGLRQQILCEPINISDNTLRELNERFAIIYTGQRRLARNLLREIVGKYIGADPDALEVLYDIQRIAVLMRFELEKDNIDGFAELLNKHWSLSQKLDKGCTNTCINQIFLSIEDLICGKMICGAGGGGFLQVILKKNVSIDRLRERLDSVFADSGVDVWNCEFWV